LNRHRRLDDARAAQRRAHDDLREAEGQTGQEPIEVRDTRLLGRRIGGDRRNVFACKHIAADQRCERARHGEQHRLVEHEIGVGLIATADGLRDQRDGADAEHLRQRHDDEHQRAGRTDAGHGGVAEARNEIQIDEEVQRLKDHAGRHRSGHREDVRDDRALGQVFH
jgi:hypothetical protein